MVKDLEKFYEYITLHNDKIATYEDPEGNYCILAPTNLLVAVEYNRLDQKHYEQAVFQGLIPKDIICNEVETTVPIPKSEITGKDNDKFILVDKTVKVKEVWFAMNQLNIRKAFTTLEDALTFAKITNKKILDVCKVKYEII